MRIDIADGCIGDRIDAIAGQPHFSFIVVVEDRVVGVGSKFKHIRRQPVLIAKARRRRHGPLHIAIVQVPLANIACLIACIGKVVGHRAAVGGQGNGIAMAAGGRGVEPRLQAGSRRSAHGLAGEGMRRVGVLAPQAVEIGRQAHRIAVQTRCIPALLVGKEYDNIWFVNNFRHILPVAKGACSRSSAVEYDL